MANTEIETLKDEKHEN